MQFVCHSLLFICAFEYIPHNLLPFFHFQYFYIWYIKVDLLLTALPAHCAVLERLLATRAFSTSMVVDFPHIFILRRKWWQDAQNFSWDCCKWIKVL